MTEKFLSRFTPSLMSSEALEAVFVQREPLAARLVELVRTSVLTKAKHHTLLVGPRGIGKTHMVSLIYNRVRAMTDLKDRMLVAWLREEEWGVTSFLDLLLRILRALVNESREDNRAEEAQSIEHRIDALYELPAGEAELAARNLLKDIANGRTLVLIVENLDEIFHNIGEEGQQQLRSYIQENPFITTVATSQSLFGGVSLQTSPFYGFFRISHLEELTFEDSAKLLENIARFKGEEDLVSFIRTPEGRARVRTIYDLAGGNHRIYVILSEFLTPEGLDELVGPFMSMLDDLTPYYQERMRWLSPQQRKIVELLCDMARAVNVKEIAQRTFMTHQTASGQLRTLRELGYVKSKQSGRESFYELREPLMRLTVEVKKARGTPVRLLVDFLRSWHSPEELRTRLEGLGPQAALESEYVTHALKLAENEKDDPRASASARHYNSYVDAGDFKHALEAAEELVEIRGHAKDWYVLWACLNELSCKDEAEKAEEKALATSAVDATDWFFKGQILALTGRREEALEPFAKALELDPTNTSALTNYGITLVELRRFEEALAAIDRSIELNENDTRPWIYRGLIMVKLGKLPEAIASYDRVIELSPDDPSGWVNKTYAYCEFGKFNEALPPSERGVELAPNDYKAWANRGWVFAGLKRFEEALRHFDRSIELEPSKGLLFSNRGQALLELERNQEALIAFTKEVEIEQQSTQGWVNRGIALERLERFNDALASFDRALEIDPNYTDAWVNRGAVLNTLRQYEEALTSLNKAYELGARSTFVLLHSTVAELALNRWQDGRESIDHVLYHSCHVHGPSSRDAERIVRAVFDSSRDPGAWQTRASLLVELYDKYGGLHALGIALVRHVGDLSEQKVGKEELDKWRDAWVEATGGRAEFEVPLRLLTTAVKYIRSKDQLTLLEIAEEERNVLEPLLGLRVGGESDYEALSKKIRGADAYA
jgi:tetratricopeptide (TPR) repeat protein